MNPLDLTRREFTRSMLASAPVVLATGAAQGQNVQPVDGLADDAEALAGMVRRRYGKFLAEEQLALVRKALLHKEHRALQLQRVQLRNSDEPAFIFRV